MNTHLHIMEAYTNLYRVSPFALLKARIRELIHLFLEKFLHPDTWHLTLFFTAAWEPRSEEISYGHDIEASWLTCEAAKVIKDQDLISRCETAALHIARATLEGQEPDGGLVNEGSPIGFTNNDKDWWPQFEAMVGWVNAWQISQDDTFREAALNAWDFTYHHHKDQENGEWHWSLDRDGKPNFKEDKAGPWKTPYHIVRALDEVQKRSMIFPNQSHSSPENIRT